MKKFLFLILLITSPVFAETAKLQSSDGTVISSSNPLPVTVISGGGGSGAPTDATYVTQTANATLSAEQALSALSTGIMRVATTTGAITALTDSAGLIANISDETGSGVLVFGTSPTFTTGITVPLVIGGTTTTSDLFLQTTSGVGTTGADAHILVGSNGGTEAVTVLNSGNVGIGSTNPATKLDVNGTGFFRGTTLTFSNVTAPLFRISDTSNPDTGDFACTNALCYLGTSTNTRFDLFQNNAVKATIAVGGNVGIGTTAPAALFSVGATSQFQVDSSGIVTPAGYKSADGTAGVTVTTCTSFKNGLCVGGT